MPLTVLIAVGLDSSLLDIHGPGGKGEFFRSPSDRARRDFDTPANRIQCHAAEDTDNPAA